MGLGGTFLQDKRHILAESQRGGYSELPQVWTRSKSRNIWDRENEEVDQVLLVHLASALLLTMYRRIRRMIVQPSVCSAWLVSLSVSLHLSSRKIPNW